MMVSGSLAADGRGWTVAGDSADGATAQPPGLDGRGLAQFLIECGCPARLARRAARAFPVGDLPAASAAAEIGMAEHDPDVLLRRPALAPCLARSAQGGWQVVRSVEPAGVIVDDGRPARGTLLDRDTFRSSFRRVVRLTPPRADGGTARFGLRWFLPTTFKYRRLIAEALLATFVIQALSLAVPLAFQTIIDRVLVSQAPSSLYAVIGLLVGVAVFQAMLGFLRTYQGLHVSFRITAELSSRIYDHLYRLPLPFFHQTPVGQITARLGEVGRIQGFLTGTASSVAFSIVFGSLFIVVMLAISPLLTAIVLGSMPIHLAIYFGLGRLIRARLQENFAERAAYEARLVETLAQMETIKALNHTAAVTAGMGDHVAATLATAFRARILSTVSATATAFTTRFVEAAVILLGAQQVIQGSLTLGQLVAFYMIMGRVKAPLLQLSSLWETWQEVRVSIARLREIMDEPIEDRAGGGRAVPSLRGDIVFQNVTVRYPGAVKPALADASFVLPPGQMVAVVGESGSGKSTLVRALTQMIPHQAGTIRIGGINLSRVDLEDLRDRIGYVPQDVRLFRGTVRQNLSPDAPADDAQIARALEAADLTAVIDRLPGRLDTPLEEGGTNLSGGQRQRLALARALVRQPDILVLDEATSALDPETEARIFDRLRDAFAGRTIIAITHRPTVAQRADRVLRLVDGVVDQDRPAPPRGAAARPAAAEAS